ncbi:MAG TPA: sulfurtransferase TusA family protein [Anaerolineae bacterium]|nr:sulfurtransferase TusA family protein [Anaerolineae bacterium]
MSEFTPEKTLDAKGLKCPMPVVKTSKEIKDISVGGVLEILATDPGSMADITAWTKSTGNELLKAQKDGDVFKFYIRRVK